MVADKLLGLMTILSHSLSFFKTFRRNLESCLCLKGLDDLRRKLEMQATTDFDIYVDKPGTAVF